MERTSVMLPEELRRQAQARARELNLTLGQFIQAAVEHELERRETEKDPLFSLPVFNDEGPQDVSSRLDEYLYGKKS